MASKEKALCFVRESMPMGRDVLPRLLRNILDEHDVVRERGLPCFVIPADMFGKLPAAEELRIFKERKVEKLPGPVRDKIESLSGFTIFIRGAFAMHQKMALGVIEALQGENHISLNSINSINDWPVIVDPSFLKRKIGIVKISEVGTEVTKYELKGKIFAKPKVKTSVSNGVVMDVPQLLEANEKGLPCISGPFSSHDGFLRIKSDIELILSEPVPIETDNDNKLEHRFWVVNQSVACFYSSPYFDEQRIVPAEAVEFANDFVLAHKGKLPGTYVVDVGLTSDRGYVVIELNEPTSAGGTNRERFTRILDTYLAS